MSVTLTGVRRAVGAHTILDGLDLVAEKGSILALLGPSGSGKTSCLRVIAGLDPVDGGTVRLGDRDVTHVPPEKRGVGMVFQTWALWPHRTVRANVAWPLQLRGIADANARADALLGRVQLGGTGDRYPHTMSGGQQQRVALARALAIEPDVLLLDEPLSSLDAALRDELRALLAEVIRERGLTAVLVSHDPEEALSLADRVAILQAGKVTQVGTPAEVYATPRTEAAARLTGPVAVVGATRRGGRVDLLGWHGASAGPDGAVRVAIRPEDVGFSDGKDAAHGVPFTVERASFRGARTRYRVRAEEVVVEVEREAPPIGRLRVGRAVVLEATESR
ncbi:MAG: ABC transporter ATP-binding protein [Pseudomonadota bacterium]|nr:ABC transporter ATP-binding protein [Pseudomonadota bacterium]